MLAASRSPSSKTNLLFRSSVRLLCFSRGREALLAPKLLKNKTVTIFLIFKRMLLSRVTAIFFSPTTYLRDKTTLYHLTVAPSWNDSLGDRACMHGFKITNNSHLYHVFLIENVGLV